MIPSSNKSDRIWISKSFFQILDTSSCECKKVVSDILGVIEGFFTDMESTGYTTYFEPSAGLNSKYLHFYGRNKMSKNNKIGYKGSLKTNLPFL